LPSRENGSWNTWGGQDGLMDDLDRCLEKRAHEDAELRERWQRVGIELGFRKAIIGARLAAGVSQGQLARLIGSSESIVTRMEVGAYRPRLETLLKVAAALNVAFDIDATGLHLRQGPSADS
jgi:ribosome-binding protein aMBF1 (putative translation factor)